MKQALRSALALCMAVLLLAALCSCGMAKPYQTMEEFVASDEMQQKIASMADQMHTETYDMEIVGKDNQLIYDFVYKVDLDVDSTAKNLEAEFAKEDSEAQYQAILVAAALVVDVDDPVIIIRYSTKDGQQIFAKEYRK